MVVRSLDEDGFWESFIVEYVCSINFENYRFDPTVFTSKILNKNMDKIVDEINAMKNHLKDPVIFGNRRYYLRDIEYISVGYQMLGQLILETGATLPESLKEKILETTSWEYDKRWGWDSNRVEIRKFYLNEFRQHIINYIKGNIPCFRVLEIKSDKELESSSIGLEELYQNVKDKRCYIIRYVNLQCCNLKEIPDELFDFKYIEKLDLSKNKLKVLPDNFRDLKSLKIINLSHNQLQTIPVSFKALVNLERLNLYDNKIKFLPNWLKRLRFLFDLYVEKNPTKVPNTLE